MLTAKDSILLIVDVQGQLAQIMNQTAQLHHNLSILISGAQLLDIPIIWIEQLPNKLGQTSPELVRLLEKSTQPIAKSHFSAWQCQDIQTQLKQLNRPNVLLAGIEAHVCVYQTCQDLLEHDFKVHLVADATSSRSNDHKILGIQMMMNLGAKLTNVESTLFEIQHQASGETFKALLKLIK
ncbi:isochorismatase family protein [Shewanella sp. SR44-3]|uniref:isochorismatase family protein n=1 Tax=Shewanella sp. SR44-3 TaxID=2760936 RepID=UPI0015FBEA5C|nr:isochorismatase family protein [Shewanella sp. SR44-3]MBB1270018.1 isochorismatase family protein [Shewanella sp. SR44-3]